MSDKFKDTDLREALRRKYANTPQLPTDFIDQMSQLQQPAPKRPWHWVAAAAVSLLIIGIGATLMFYQDKPEHLHHVVAYAPSAKETVNQLDQGDTQPDLGLRSDQEPIPAIRKQEPVCKTHQSILETHKKAPETHDEAPQSDPNLHYAADVTEEDTTAYQDPARMDEFIAKLAEFNKVKGIPLNCSTDPNDSLVVSTAYVFDDRKGLDLFARLLQAACWYDSKTPGYLLNFSRRQFFFTLKDQHRGAKYIWITERLMDGRILLFSTHSPIEAPASLTCYQKLLEQLTNTDYILSQF